MGKYKCLSRLQCPFAGDKAGTLGLALKLERVLCIVVLLYRVYLYVK